MFPKMFDFGFRTPLNYAVLGGHHRVAKLLLDRGASVDGGAKDRAGSVRSTETPLQLAAAVGSVRTVELLLSHGATPFFSSLESNQDMGFSAPSQTTGCYPAVSVSAIHGHKKILRYEPPNPDQSFTDFYTFGQIY